MNKTDVIKKVSEISQIEVSDCKKVIDALEKVVSDELSSSKRKSYLFNTVYKIMSVLKKK